MANINARSPYIITINEAGQIETKIEIFLWNGTGSAPASPTYTLSKLIPSATSPSTYYDISPYIREFIDHDTLQSQPTTISNTPIYQWCNVLVKKYKKVTTSFAAFGTNLNVKAFNGFGYYTDGYNPALSQVHLPEGNYYYNPISNVGWITVYTDTITKARWTNLDTLATQEETMFSSVVRDISKVYNGWEDVGNKLEILDGSGVIWTSYFYPKGECRYIPVQVDFVNRFGAWQREWFFTASFDTLSVDSNDYNLMQSSFADYSITEGQRKVFNANGKQSIKVNSDWVAESFKETIQQIMLSERILVNELPAKLNTKTIDLQKQLNTRLINYQLDFEFAFDTINTVI